MFTRKLTSQQKWMILLIFIPLYYYCGSVIVSAGMYFVLKTFSLTYDVNTLNAYLNLFADLLFIIVIVFIFKDSLKEQWHDFCKDVKGHLFYGIVIGTALLLAFNMLGGFITLLLGQTSVSENQNLINTLMQDHLFLMAFLSIICAPIIEELLFRGAVFAWLYEIHPLVAHALSSFLFGFIHIMQAVMAGNTTEWAQIFSYMLMGGVLSYLYEKKNNIFVPMLSHSMSNFISVLLIVFVK